MMIEDNWLALNGKSALTTYFKIEDINFTKCEVCPPLPVLL